MKLRSICLLLTLTAQLTMASIMDSVEHHSANNQGVSIHYVAVGDTNHPLIVMIHGFPDFWYTWRKQMEALQSSYRVVAVDLRGYNESDQPEGVENYKLTHLVDDIAAVIAAEDREQAVVVGHDWGGAIAWRVAMTKPELVSQLVILNLPHPQGLSRELATNPAQQESSQYAFNFQHPEAHTYLNAEGLTFWVADPEARKHYVSAFEKSSFEAMLNYYKANYPKPGEGFFEDYPKVKMPVLMFHGLDDTALLPGALAGTWDWVEQDLTLVTIPGASHFVQQDAPQIINETMVDWLARRVATEGS